MKRILTDINGYDILECSMGYALRHGYDYPCYCAYRCDCDVWEPQNEECSMGDLQDLVNWCENN